MKTAISVPDDVFREANRLAKQLEWSRSHLFARAVTEFAARHGADPVTVALDALVDELATQPAPTVGRDLIASGAWEW